MARKIIYRENGLTGSNNTPGGYKYLGYDGLVLSEKTGATISAIGGGDYLPLSGGTMSGNIVFGSAETQISNAGGYLTLEGSAGGRGTIITLPNDSGIVMSDSAVRFTAGLAAANLQFNILTNTGGSANEKLKIEAKAATNFFGYLNFPEVTAERNWYLPNDSGNLALTKNQGYDNFIEVSISSAEILSLSTTPKDVLPVLTGSDYYDYKVIFEYTYGTTPYSNGGGGYFFIVDNFGRELTTMENLDALTYSFASNYPAFGAEQNQPARVRPATGLSCSMAFATTLGDGTVNLKVYYTTHTL